MEHPLQPATYQGAIRTTLNLQHLYFPINGIGHTDTAARFKGQHETVLGQMQQEEESLGMSRPFIGYTFKQLDKNSCQGFFTAHPQHFDMASWWLSMLGFGWDTTQLHG